MKKKDPRSTPPPQQKGAVRISRRGFIRSSVVVTAGASIGFNSLPNLARAALPTVTENPNGATAVVLNGQPQPNVHRIQVNNLKIKNNNSIPSSGVGKHLCVQLYAVITGVCAGQKYWELGPIVKVAPQQEVTLSADWEYVVNGLQNYINLAAAQENNFHIAIREVKCTDANCTVRAKDAQGDDLKTKKVYEVKNGGNSQAQFSITRTPPP